MALAVPVFGLAIAGEWWLARRRGREASYHPGVAAADIGCGALYQALELVLRIAVLGVYGLCYEHARLVDWDSASGWPWVIGLLGVDLAYYAWHRVSHVVNALWAVHAVHHQSEDYNFAVALRQPLAEPLTWMPFLCIFAVLGIPVEVALASFAANMFYQFWLHTELVGRLPRPLEWVLNTPSHHRAHHGIEPEYLDKNYGGVLILWDRLFGTFEPERRPPTYGTTDPLRSLNPLWGNAAHWYYMLKLAATARSRWDALRVLVAHPSWRPVGVAASVGGRRPARYRPSVSAKIQLRALAGLGVAVTAATTLLLFEASLSVGQLLLGFGALAAVVVAATSALERRG
ncbi:MAG: sterol desaturase family protein [Nannocystaceae bacterium]|nr:sterol desaturase family protein [Nannocystaceae bacterium]